MKKLLKSEVCESMNWTAPRTLHSCKSDHTGSNSGQDHKACKEFSDEAWHPMKHGCVSRLGCGCGCGCGTRQFLKKVGAGAAGLGD